jgi:hypothetical protein
MIGLPWVVLLGMCFAYNWAIWVEDDSTDCDHRSYCLYLSVSDEYALLTHD